MSNGNSSCSANAKKDQMEIQDAEIRERLNHIKNKVLVMSGKGGVGKSSVAAFLSVALAKKGFSVGLMDVDLHGPSIPRMLGLKGGLTPSTTSEKAAPVSLMPNLSVISIEVLLGDNKDVATIWRGPLKIGVIKQFISDIEWPELDYLIIDSPPGTGDEPLTVAQTIPDARALIVTTPQEISLADVRKSINFCRQVNMDILGLVENMSGFKCPHCGEAVDLFKSDGGQLMAKKENLKLLGTLPLDPEVVKRGDAGDLPNLVDTEIPFVKEFSSIVESVSELMSSKAALENRSDTTTKEKEIDMSKIIIAVPTAGGKLCAHFGHCEQFALVETEDGEIKGTSMQTPPPPRTGSSSQMAS